MVALLLLPFNWLMRLIQNTRLKPFFGTVLEGATMIANSRPSAGVAVMSEGSISVKTDMGILVFVAGETDPNEEY